jgi:hypothetical protein
MIWIAVIAALVLLIKFPKQMLLIGGIAAAGIALIVILEVAANNRYKRERDAVTVVVKFDTTKCGPSHPLFVTIRNNGSKVVSKVTWRFAAYRPGFSSDLTEYGYSEPSSDKILAGGESYTACYPDPKIKGAFRADDLEWTVKNKRVHFKDP